jgi:hypothetical protein
VHEDGKKLLELMFRPSETVCVSPSKYGYHSISLSEILNNEEITLVPTPESCIERNIKWEDAFEKSNPAYMTLVALNPIKGWRKDEYCTAFRNFLIEMDTGDIANQIEYIKNIGMPYSAMVFSGSKSVHTLISLDEDLPNERIYRFIAEWILSVATLADPLTKNPSRSIRIPGAYRTPTKLQTLIEIKSSIKLMDLMGWLAKHPNVKPKPYEKKIVSEHPNFDNIAPWAKGKLINGLDPKKGRNQQWYAIAMEFALQGYSYDATISLLEQYFTPDRDFKKKEWETTVGSAFKKVENGK